MDERLKRYAYALLSARVLADLAVAALIYRRAGSLSAAAAFLPLCGVFYAFLFFGFRNEEFPGRYGRKVVLWREPFAYWLVVALLFVFHLAVTGLMLQLLLH